MIRVILAVVFQQAFEIWLWWQAIMLALGTPATKASAEQLFWYYILSLFLTVLAMAIVYLSHNERVAEKNQPDHYLGIGLVLLIFGLLLIPHVPFLWKGALDTVFPAVSPLLLLGLFGYKFSVFMILKYVSKTHNEVYKSAGHLYWQLAAVFCASWISVGLDVGASYNVVFLVSVVPIYLVFDSLLTYFEQRGSITTSVTANK